LPYQAGDERGALIAALCAMAVWVPVRIVQVAWLAFLYAWECRRLWTERYSFFHWACMYVSAYGLLALNVFWFSKMIKMAVRAKGGGKKTTKTTATTTETTSSEAGVTGRAVPAANKKQD
jgi:hypothetical protein